MYMLHVFLRVHQQVHVHAKCVDLARAQPRWCEVQVADNADYLGFALGFVWARKACDSALAKCLDRAAVWSQAASGFFAIATACSVYVYSVVRFLAQLDSLPPQWPQVKAEVFRRLVLGVSQWAKPIDLHNVDQ